MWERKQSSLLVYTFKSALAGLQRGAVGAAMYSGWHHCCQHLPLAALPKGDSHSPAETGKSGVQVGTCKSQITERRGVLNKSTRNTKRAMCLKPCLWCFPRDAGIHSPETTACGALPALFHSQGLGNALRRWELNTQAASPLQNFVLTDLHYTKIR